MKLSIIIPYYNRRQILFNTLKSIEYFKGGSSIETIVIDDDSDKENKIDDYVTAFSSINMKLIVLTKPIVKWRGPVISSNVGFLHATGDVLMLNGADCMHMGPIIDYTFKNFKEGTYMTFSSYRGTDKINQTLSNFNWNKLNELIASLDKSSADKWHVHSKFLVKLYPFVAAISKADIEKLSGYDERYANGVGYDDDDLVQRILNLKLDTQLVDDPFCMHQKHPFVQYYSQDNKHLFNRLQEREPNRTKATHNSLYVK